MESSTNSPGALRTTPGADTTFRASSSPDFSRSCLESATGHAKPTLSLRFAITASPLSQTSDSSAKLNVTASPQPKRLLPPCTSRHRCPTCKKVFTTKRRLASHKRSHKLHQCDLCHKTVKDKQSLDRHLTDLHSETFKFVCECGYKVRSREDNFKRHQEKCKVISRKPRGQG